MSAETSSAPAAFSSPAVEPHAENKMLVELFELADGSSWNETARWIKYEEDIEGVDKHWGRPHVAFLAFHSLLQIRQCIAKGVILLDLVATDLSAILQNVCEAIITEYQSDPENIRKIVFALQQQKVRRASLRFNVLRRNSVVAKLQQNDSSRKSSVGHSQSPAHKDQPVIFEIGHANEAFSSDQIPDGQTSPATSDVQRKDSSRRGSVLRALSTSDDNVVNMVPMGSEVAQIYAGVIPALKKMKFAMVRLTNAIATQELMSSKLPVRFMFVIVGPPVDELDYHELGRSIATLMANPTFNRIAYAAASREDLLEGVDSFMDGTIVIPPGDIDSRTLLSVDDIRKALRKRKLIALKLAEEAHTAATLITAAKILDEEVGKGKVKEVKPAPKHVRVDHVKDSLRRTGRFFGGLIDDIKYRFPYYKEDFRDALHFQCITATLFMFFANFASAVAFGQVFDEKMEGWMGVTEMLISHCVCGVVWGFIACQPLCIQAAVGPFLVLEDSLFAFCKSQNIDFLAMRLWTGFWTVVLTIIVTMVEGSFLVQHLTRFTEDIFTGLIALIFIWEAIKYFFKELNNHPLQSLDSYCAVHQSKLNRTNNTLGLYSSTYNNKTLFRTMTAVTEQSGVLDVIVNGTEYTVDVSHLTERVDNKNQPDTALLTLILIIATFALAFCLKRLRTSVYLGRTVRKVVGDFAVPIAVLVIVFIDHVILKESYLPSLDMPITFGLTNPDRRHSWFVSPFGNGQESMPVWAMFAAIIPAILVGILVFAEVEIIEFLLAKKERGLKRPHGFHWDLMVCSVMCLVCGFLGMPWMCPAAVQTLSHQNALMVMKRAAPGEAPKIDYVVEQRVTCIMVALLHGIAAFAGIILRQIPVAALFGLFVFLGVMGLINLQFVHRLVLFFVPRKYFPEHPYCRQVSMWRMHWFTVIQLICFGILWTINMIRSAAIAFPFVLTVIAVFRVTIMPKMFTAHELRSIDGKEDEKREVEEDHDDIENVYEAAKIPM